MTDAVFSEDATAIECWVRLLETEEVESIIENAMWQLGSWTLERTISVLALLPIRAFG